MRNSILAWARIGIACTVFLLWLQYLPNITSLFSIDGSPAPLVSIALLGPQSVLWTKIMYGLALLPIALVFVGWDTRINALSIVLYFLYYYQIAFHQFVQSYHGVLMAFVVLLVIFETDQKMSLRSRVES